MKKFKKEFYQNIKINNLILYAIFSLLNKKEECVIENIMKECFFLFPESFGFFLYPQWPDIRRIDRPLRHLKQGGIIKKNNNDIFSFTKEGEKKIQELIKIFKQGRLKF